MLCKNLFLLLAILSLLIKICTSWGGGLIKTKGGIVVFGDRMVQTYYDGLNQVMERLIRDDPDELTPEDVTRILSEMANQHTLLPADDRNKRRIQQVAGKNGKQFTVSFADDYENTLDHFVKADKSGVDSLKSLANLLEQVHYDAAHEQACEDSGPLPVIGLHLSALCRDKLPQMIENPLNPRKSYSSIDFPQKAYFTRISQ